MFRNGEIMTTKYHDTIDELKNQTQSMGILASQMLKDSVTALENFDMSLADDVRERRHELAKMDHDIEDKVLRTIALNQPRASDMRLLGTILKIITYQNRIGRYGKDIASIAIGMDEKKHLAKLVKIPKMTKKVSEMLDTTLEAFRTSNSEKLQGMDEKDNEVDELRWSIFRDCLKHMFDDKKNIERGADYMLVARYLERCGDHVCKMSEKIHYMDTGNHIEIK